MPGGLLGGSVGPQDLKPTLSQLSLPKEGINYSAGIAYFLSIVSKGAGILNET